MPDAGHFTECSRREPSGMDGQVERPSEWGSESKALQILLTSEQLNDHFSQDQFVIKLRGNQLNICCETRSHGLN